MRASEKEQGERERESEANNEPAEKRQNGEARDASERAERARRARPMMRRIACASVARPVGVAGRGGGGTLKVGCVATRAQDCHRSDTTRDLYSSVGVCAGRAGGEGEPFRWRRIRVMWGGRGAREPGLSCACVLMSSLAAMVMRGCYVSHYPRRAGTGAGVVVSRVESAYTTCLQLGVLGVSCGGWRAWCRSEEWLATSGAWGRRGSGARVRSCEQRREGGRVVIDAARRVLARATSSRSARVAVRYERMHAVATVVDTVGVCV